MAVSQFYRNEFTALETGKRAKPTRRECIDCSADIPTAGGKKRCSGCSDRINEQRRCARDERERKARLAASAPRRHSWGLPNRFAEKTERCCLNCPIIKVTFHQIGERGQDYCWTEFYRGTDRIECERTPVCEVTS